MIDAARKATGDASRTAAVKDRGQTIAEPYGRALRAHLARPDELTLLEERRELLLQVDLVRRNECTRFGFDGREEGLLVEDVDYEMSPFGEVGGELFGRPAGAGVGEEAGRDDPGQVRGQAAARDVIIDTGSGSVEAELSGQIDDLAVDTGSGSVTLRLPASLDATLTIETGSGGIDVDFPLSITRRARDELRGQIGEGRGRIVIDTGSGSVSLRRM